MTLLRLEQLELVNFRCFAALEVAFEPDVTLFFAENGGGKTAALDAIAMSLGLLQPSHPRELMLSGERDARRVRGPTGLREPAGPCAISCTASIGPLAGVSWSVAASPTSRKYEARVDRVSDAIERVRQPGARWPILGYYGTNRLAGRRKARGRAAEFTDRWDGYTDCLDPWTSDGPLLDWLKLQVHGDLTRGQRGETERGLARGVLQAIRRAIPELADLWYDPAVGFPIARFADDSEATWDELSDGFHVFMGLVGDIARRAVILNPQDGAEAPELVEGVVLIDEIDLHLHPRWQQTALPGLRAAFPRLQLVLTTHSPQVLSSVENRQARPLVGGKISEQRVFVEGRDSNAILRELMNTSARDPQGAAELRKLDGLIDSGQLAEARALLERLKTQKWGDLDPELIRREGLVDDASADRES